MKLLTVVLGTMEPVAIPSGATYLPLGAPPVVGALGFLPIWFALPNGATVPRMLLRAVRQVPAKFRTAGTASVFSLMYQISKHVLYSWRLQLRSYLKPKAGRLVDSRKTRIN
jgi:hypothetical protein